MTFSACTKFKSESTVLTEKLSLWKKEKKFFFTCISINLAKNLAFPVLTQLN